MQNTVELHITASEIAAPKRISCEILQKVKVEDIKTGVVKVEDVRTVVLKVVVVTAVVMIVGGCDNHSGSCNIFKIPNTKIRLRCSNFLRLRLKACQWLRSFPCSLWKCWSVVAQPRAQNVKFTRISTSLMICPRTCRLVGVIMQTRARRHH